MRRKKIIGAAFAVALSLTMAVLAAADGFTLFGKFRDDMRTARMTFKQTNYDKQGIVLETITGTLWYRAPNLFRMEYDEVDKPLVVSDGKSLWVYEADLQQATVRPLEAVKENSLLSILSAKNLDSLKDRYVFSSGVAKDLIWLVGSTLWEDDQVRRVQLGFAPTDGALKRLEMVDSFGGGILLDIAKLTRSDETGEWFSFTPPDSADVIRIGE